MLDHCFTQNVIDYLLIVRSGTQCKKLNNLVSILTFQAIGNTFILPVTAKVWKQKVLYRLSSKNKTW